MSEHDLLETRDFEVATAISDLAYCNPFLPERVDAERRALGEEFIDRGTVWSVRSDVVQSNPNTQLIGELTERLLARMKERFLAGARPTAELSRLYEDLTVYVLFYRYESRLLSTILDGLNESVPYWKSFRDDYEQLSSAGSVALPSAFEATHLFACLYQVRRAFHHIFSNIAGSSMPAARLRAEVWQSIFSHDLRRYRRLLFDRMGEIATLITGPTGTGKELVARAIASSRYVSFDANRERFTENPDQMIGVNLAAVTPTLVEATLFGHRKGAFTGALENRPGLFELSGRGGTVFLDEIGELDESIQVKLLRVLQTRSFTRLGDGESRAFDGKLIAATNRDLGQEIERGRFREDLYYRLCSDLVSTASLREQLDDRPEDLENLVLFIATWVVGESEAQPIASEVIRWIRDHLGDDYPWPGNFRELEQCVRNVLLRGRYEPRRVKWTRGLDSLKSSFTAGSLTADELMSAYATIVYARTGNYVETGRRLGIDRRTVKARIDRELLEELRGAGY